MPFWAVLPNFRRIACMIREVRPGVRSERVHVKGRRRGVSLFVGAALAALSLFVTADIWPNAVPNDPTTNCTAPTNPGDNTQSQPTDPSAAPGDPSVVDPSAVDPSAVDPSAVDPSAVDPSAVDPSAVDPSTVDPSTVDQSDGDSWLDDSSVGDGLSGDESAGDPTVSDPSASDPAAVCPSDSGQNGNKHGKGRKHRQVQIDPSPDALTPDGNFGGVPLY